jgi:hypothetical protein
VPPQELSIEFKGSSCGGLVLNLSQNVITANFKISLAYSYFTCFYRVRFIAGDWCEKKID